VCHLAGGPKRSQRKDVQHGGDEDQDLRRHSIKPLLDNVGHSPLLCGRPISVASDGADTSLHTNVSREAFLHVTALAS
jgi:hypothetical protein